ncbi:MAG TPA: KGG domain-containing protein [Candidatus Paceibacterota bacterium]|nr:KGG domain-containing protein [Candidatus Paceibacterota bacterium]
MANRDNKDRAGGAMSVSEAGKKGGERTRETHGHEFYREIGHKGGQVGGPRVRELIEEGKRREEGVNNNKLHTH